MKCRRMPPSGWVPSWPRRSKKQHRKPQKTAGSTEPTSPVLPEIFPVWVLFGSNQISKNSIRQKSDGKQEKTLGFPKKPEGQWSECRDSNPGPLGPEDSAEKSGGAFRPVWFCLFQQKVLSSLLHSNAYVRSPHSLGHYLGQTAIPVLRTVCRKALALSVPCTVEAHFFSILNTCPDPLSIRKGVLLGAENPLS